MSKESAFESGFERGEKGCHSSKSIWDTLDDLTPTYIEPKDVSEARERGFEAGVVVRALRDDN